MSVVVDTSVWVEYFRGSGADDLEQLLSEGRVLLSPVVAAELLSAPLAAVERRQLTELLASLESHPTPASHWFAVGDLRARLSKRGLAVSTPDAHVAQCGIDAGAPVWSSDRIFGRISRHSDLRLFSP